MSADWYFDPETNERFGWNAREPAKVSPATPYYRGTVTESSLDCDSDRADLWNSDARVGCRADRGRLAT